MKIRKVVVPAAGLGTRFLPTTKSVPKELLPLFDKPLIQYGVEEAVAAGIEQVIIVTSHGKEGLAHYFNHDPALEKYLQNSDYLDQVRAVSSLAEVSYVIQEQPLGLGHAVLTAKEAVGDEPFLMILPDDVILHDPGATQQMLSVFEKYGASVVAVEAIPMEAVKAYGVVDSSAVEERVYKVNGLVEKPDPADAPSNLAIVGRYVLTPEIFGCLENTKPGAKGEIQITDGMALLLQQQDLYAYQFEGVRLDGGTPLGLLKASLQVGLDRQDTRADVLKLLDDIS